MSGKFLLLLAFTLFSSEWKSYRCIIKTTVTVSGNNTSTLLTIACKRDGTDVSIRTTQLAPEKGRFISISKNGEESVFYPENGELIRRSQVYSEQVNLDSLTNSLFRAGLGSSAFIACRMPKEIGALIGADSLTAYRNFNGTSVCDSITFFKGVLPISKTVLLKNYIQTDGNQFLMPTSITTESFSPKVSTKIEYSGYRINAEIPDESFNSRFLE
ncbi:MAG: hypothetical protein JNL74_06840 [Fibrobacteres bacterium]|nr:hypothetical protein [Fibrobacterota bacterium]